MALALRRLSLAIALLTFLPTSGHAAAFAIGAGWLNSSLTFGSATYQDDGYDIASLFIHDQEVISGCCGEHVLFSAGGGAFASKTTSPGHTVWTYTGGIFSVRVEGDAPFYTAPVDFVEIDVSGTIEPGADISVVYQLGDGSFHPAFAALYGIPVPTGPGRMFESLILLKGDERSAELVADDGGGNLEVEAAVPEPALSLLMGLGVLAACKARASRTR
jgi:hypothetical protein